MEDSPSFGKLPRELRDKIAEGIFPLNRPVIINSAFFTFGNHKCKPSCIHHSLQEGWLTVCKQSRKESLPIAIGKSIFMIRTSGKEVGHWSLESMDELTRRPLTPMIRTLQIDFGSWELAPRSPPVGLVRAWENLMYTKMEMHPDCKVIVEIQLAMEGYPGSSRFRLRVGKGYAVCNEKNRKREFYDEGQLRIQAALPTMYPFQGYKANISAPESGMEK